MEKPSELSMSGHVQVSSVDHTRSELSDARDHLCLISERWLHEGSMLSLMRQQLLRHSESPSHTGPLSSCIRVHQVLHRFGGLP